MDILRFLNQHSDTHRAAIPRATYGVGYHALFQSLGRDDSHFNQGGEEVGTHHLISIVSVVPLYLSILSRQDSLHPAISAIVRPNFKIR